MSCNPWAVTAALLPKAVCQLLIRDVKFSGRDSNTSHFQSSMALAPQKSLQQFGFSLCVPCLNPTSAEQFPFGFLWFLKGQVLLWGGLQTTVRCLFPLCCWLCCTSLSPSFYLQVDALCPRHFGSLLVFYCVFVIFLTGILRCIILSRWDSLSLPWITSSALETWTQT